MIATTELLCAFDFGYRDTPEKPNPAEAMIRDTKLHVRLNAVVALDFRSNSPIRGHAELTEIRSGILQELCCGTTKRSAVHIPVR